MPRLGHSDVHVKMLAAPINPADINMIQGNLPTARAAFEPLPCLSASPRSPRRHLRHPGPAAGRGGERRRWARAGGRPRRDGAETRGLGHPG